MPPPRSDPPRGPELDPGRRLAPLREAAAHDDRNHRPERRAGETQREGRRLGVRAQEVEGNQEEAPLRPPQAPEEAPHGSPVTRRWSGCIPVAVFQQAAASGRPIAFGGGVVSLGPAGRCRADADRSARVGSPVRAVPAARLDAVPPMADDPYVDPGTDVLRNHFGIRDAVGVLLR